MGGLYVKMGDVAASETGIVSLHLLISHIYETSSTSMCVTDPMKAMW